MEPERRRFLRVLVAGTATLSGSLLYQGCKGKSPELSCSSSEGLKSEDIAMAPGREVT